MKKSLKYFLINAAFLLITLLLLFALYLLSRIQYEEGKLSYFTYLAITITVIYFGLLFSAGILSSIRFFAYMNGLLSLPLIIFLHFIAPFVLSFIRMYTGALFVFIALYLTELELLPLLGIHLEDTTCLYFALTASIIIYSLFGNIISLYTSKVLFITDVKLIERYSFIFDQNKFSYLIYVLAFIFLVYFTFCEFNNIEQSGGMLILKKVLLPTFATFVAWDRLVSKINLFKFVAF